MTISLLETRSVCSTLSTQCVVPSRQFLEKIVLRLCQVQELLTMRQVNLACIQNAFVNCELVTRRLRGLTILRQKSLARPKFRLKCEYCLCWMGGRKIVFVTLAVILEAIKAYTSYLIPPKHF
jgi:hypothetical protein